MFKALWVPQTLGFSHWVPIQTHPQWPGRNARMHGVRHLGEGPNRGVTARQHWEPQWGMAVPMGIWLRGGERWWWSVHETEWKLGFTCKKDASKMGPCQHWGKTGWITFESNQSMGDSTWSPKYQTHFSQNLCNYNQSWPVWMPCNKLKHSQARLFQNL
jgi:hypothetical protein